VFRLLQHLKFLLTATNQHGVHSPFIFSYITKCVYVKPGYPYSKSVDVLLKSIAYFEPKKVCLIDNRQLEKTVRRHFPKIELSEGGSEVSFFSEYSQELLDTLLSEEKNIQNDCLLLLDDIYSSKEKNRIWNSTKKHRKVSVTVDMFYCGAVFFRQEQAKEHFKIRI